MNAAILHQLFSTLQACQDGLMRVTTYSQPCTIAAQHFHPFTHLPSYACTSSAELFECSSLTVQMAHSALCIVHSQALQLSSNRQAPQQKCMHPFTVYIAPAATMRHQCAANDSVLILACKDLWSLCQGNPCPTQRNRLYQGRP